MTPMPEVMPEDLMQIQVLVKERDTEIERLRDEMHEKRLNIYALQRERTLLQIQGKKLLGIKPFPKKKEPSVA